MNKFYDMPIDDSLMKGIEKCGFEEMTEIQDQVIPLALQQKDIMAQAPTGTGKTCAFALPILQKIDTNNNKVQALILAPTRELALQITDDFNKISYYKKGVKITTLYGGEFIDKQIRSLKDKPQIVVATPGRLLDHLRRKTIKFEDVEIVVLDEADEMLNMGFREDIDSILENIKNEHQTMLFSATFSKEIENICKKYLRKPEIIKIVRNELTVSSVAQYYSLVREQDKVEVISRIIDVNNYELIIIFCNTKKNVDDVTVGLMQRGFIVEGLHGDMKQIQRERVISRFKAKQINILVASDVAARGLDINDVDIVFNYDVPTDEEYYVHRVGRTGRAKKTGVSVTLVTNSEKYKLRNIIAYSKANIELINIPSLDEVCKARVDRIINQARNEFSRNSKYKKVVRDAIYDLAVKGDIYAEDIIAGLILMQMNVINDIEVVKEKEKVAKTAKTRSSKGNVTRMFISVGKKDNYKVYDLTDLIVKRTKLSNSEIDSVEMHDDFSFFEIPNKHVDECIEAFSRRIDGRRIIIEQAKAKERTRSRKKR